MDSGVAAVLGALIGTVSSPLVAWASEHFKNPATRKSDKLRRERLTKILMLPAKKWRPIEYLADAIGADVDKTKRLLLQIDARKSLSKGRDNWALVSRVGWPDEAEDEAENSN
jgi:hypothetical protein